MSEGTFNAGWFLGDKLGNTIAERHNTISHIKSTGGQSLCSPKPYEQEAKDVREAYAGMVEALKSGGVETYIDRQDFQEGFVRGSRYAARENRRGYKGEYKNR